jgi:hypothetical protein
MVAYPIGRLTPDEDQKRRKMQGTPLDRLCLDDLLRECLGIGPCESVLDKEARQAINPGIFTCSYGKTPFAFIPGGSKEQEERYAPRCLKEDRVFLKGHTDGVQVFIKYIQDRINAYVDMRANLLTYLAETEKKYPDQAEFIGRMRKEMDRPVRIFSNYSKPDIRANGEERVKPMVADYYKALKLDTPEQMRKAQRSLSANGGIPGGIGDPQDARLQSLRRHVVVWRSMATQEMARNPGPGTTEIAQEVRKRTEATLVNPAGHEKVTTW